MIRLWVFWFGLLVLLPGMLVYLRCRNWLRTRGRGR